MSSDAVAALVRDRYDDGDHLALGPGEPRIALHQLLVECVLHARRCEGRNANNRRTWGTKPSLSSEGGPESSTSGGRSSSAGTRSQVSRSSTPRSYVPATIGSAASGARSRTRRRRAARAPGADRRRERRPARRLDGHLGDRARLARGAARRPPGRGASATRPATTGGRSAATSERAVLIGGHIDSVPNGGWLDGCLNVLAGVEVLRRIAEEGTPPVTVRLVDWADEEGARFGRSLFGSSAAAGSMADQDELRAARPTATASRCPTRSPSTASTSTARSTRGAQLDDARPPTSSSTSSRARCSSRWTCRSASCSARSASSATGSPGTGQAAHAGSTPMDKRRDALAGAAKLALEIRDIAARAGDGAVCTSGGVVCKPGIVTSVVETAEQLLDQRHLDAGDAGRDARRGEGGERALRRRGERSRSSGSGSGRSSRSSSTRR